MTAANPAANDPRHLRREGINELAEIAYNQLKKSLVHEDEDDGLGLSSEREMDAQMLTARLDSFETLTRLSWDALLRETDWDSWVKIATRKIPLPPDPTTAEP